MTRRALLLCAVIALLLVSCTDAPASNPDRRPAPIAPELPAIVADPGGTLRVGLVNDPISIDPRFIADEEGELIAAALFEPLVRLDDQLRVQPAAAARWEIDDEGRTFRFELSGGVFHDGSAVTSQDFKRSFDRMVDATQRPLSPNGFLLEGIEGFNEASAGEGLAGVVAEDSRTLVIRLDEPQPGFLQRLANPALAPVPEAADDNVRQFGEQPVGNGPFRMVEPREWGTFLRLVGFDAHPRDPQIEEILFSVYADDPGQQRQWQDLLDGQLHVARIGPDHVQAAIDQFGASVDGYSGPGLIDGLTGTVYMYGFNTAEPPFDDPRVRRAISMSIDRSHLASVVMGGFREPATTLVPPPIPGSQPNACAYCVIDRQGARALWDESAPEVESIVLVHNRGVTHAAIAERIAADIERSLGITVDFRAAELSDFLHEVHEGQALLFRLGWEATEPDPGAYLRPLFHSSQIGLDNVSRYGRDEVDALLDEAVRSPLVGSRLARYRQAERLILEDMPVMPLLNYRHAIVVTDRVEGLRWPSVGQPDFSRVHLAAP